MKCSLTFLLSLLWALVEVHSQTIPYVSFMGVNLSNHAYVDITLVGSDSNNTVRCHTDLETGCTSSQGVHCGNWYFPDGSELANASGGDDNIWKHHAPQRVDIHRRSNATSPSGIYHCDIETVAVNDVGVDTITGETIYIGLYPPSEGTLKQLKFLFYAIKLYFLAIYSIA